MNQIKLNSISKCFFINLDRRTDRLDHIEENLPFFAERFRAIDGKSLELNDKIINLFPETYFKFSKGEIACALSHFKIWEKLTQDDDSDSYLILEDDVCFKDGFTSYWNQGFCEHIPQDFSIIYLGGCQPWNRPYYKYVCEPENKFFNKVKKNDFFTKDDHYWHMNASSYIISKKAAIDLCSRIYDVGFSVALDHFLIRFLNHDAICGDPGKFFHLNPLMAHQLHEKDGNTELDRNSDLRFSGEKFEEIKDCSDNQPSQEHINIKYWSNIRNNFGDELNIPVGQFLFGKKVSFNKEDCSKNIHLIGSNLGSNIDDGDFICGVGLHHNTQDINTKNAIPKCVRGPLSLKWMKSKGYNTEKINIGDPALLLKLFYEPSINDELKTKIGVVPHISNIDYIKSEIGDDDKFYLIDPTNDWKQVIDEICSCSSIISSSLHGLICSDAFNVPNVWLNIPGQSIPPCDENTNYGDFKYWDYLLSQGRKIVFVESIKESLRSKLYYEGNNINLENLKKSILLNSDKQNSIDHQPDLPAKTEGEKVKSIEELLVPKKTELTKKRYGGEGDGGYVLLKEVFNECDTVYSYGIDDSEGSDSFDVDCANHDKTVYMFDGTIDREESMVGSLRFKKENVTAENFQSHLLIDNNIQKNNMILKMDIEGNEYHVVEKNIDLIQKCFSMITLEFHGLNNPEYYSFKDKPRVISSILEHYDIFHMHANNWVERKFKVPNVMEISFVRKGACIDDLDSAYPVSGLDFPNCEGREDYILDWWLPISDFPFIKKIESTEIPKKIHLSWRDKNVLNSDYSLIKKGAKNLELLNPGWDVIVYDDEDINRLLRDSIGKDNWGLIKDKKITEKTDLWRLIKTYQEGGLYVDIDRYIDTPISEIVNEKTKCVLPTYQDIDFSQDFILTCPKNPIMASGIVKNLEYRKQGKNLFFLAVYSYMHGVSDVVSGKIVERGENPEYFENIRNKFKLHPNIETYRETGPSDHILYRNLNQDFSTESFEKDKAEFYNGSGVVHWNADTRKTHEQFNISTSSDSDNLKDSLLSIKQKHSSKKIMQVGLDSVSVIKSILGSDEDSIVVTFDSCENDIVVAKKVELDKDFSGRHALVAGNTNNTILEFAQNNNNFKFDLIFIDKVDTEIEVISALVSCKSMSHDKTVVCIDGSIDYMNTAWIKCVKQGYINEIDQDENLKCATYQLKQNENQSQLSIKQKEFIKIKDKWQDFIDYSFLNFAADNLIKEENTTEDYSCFNSGKKIGIVSLYTDEIKDYARYSEKDIKEYCLKNDYTFHIYRNSLDKSASANWSKAQAIMNHIKDHESIVWMDSDVLIYNPDKKLEDIINKCTSNKKIIACEDIGANNKKLPKGSMFNSGVVIFKNHQYTVNLIQKWLNFDGDKSSLYASGGDQEILCNIIKKSDPFLFNVKIFPMNKFNTDPRMIDDDTFIVHFMAYPYHLKILFIRYWNKILSA